MVPYRVTSTASCSSCDSGTYTTAGFRDNNPDDDLLTTACLVIACAPIPREEDLSLPLPKEKPKFDRVMKMRNTDGRPVKYSTWKPVRMYNGRDNIGTRNFKKL
jgi:hypothetical protein